MRVDFDLSLLSQGMLNEHRQAMAAMQGSIPALSLKVQEVLGAELARQRKKTAGRKDPVELVLPLLAKKELERGLAALNEFTWKLEVLALEILLEDKDLNLAREYKLSAAFSCAILPAWRAPDPRVGAHGAAGPVGCPPAQTRRISAETGKTEIAQERKSGARR